MIITLLPLMILTLIANAVEAAAGFGATLITITLGAFYFSIEELLPILIPLNLILSLSITLKYRKEIDWKSLWAKILPFSTPGLMVGILLYRTIEKENLKLTLGGIIVLLSLFQLFLNKKIPLYLIKIFLFLGGLMQGLFASGGPFTVIASEQIFKDKAKFRTTLSVLWLMLNLFMMSSLIQKNEISLDSLLKSSILLPFVFLGLSAGARLNKRLTETQFKKFIYVLLLFAGSSILIRSFVTKS